MNHFHNIFSTGFPQAFDNLYVVLHYAVHPLPLIVRVIEIYDLAIGSTAQLNGECNVSDFRMCR